MINFSDPCARHKLAEGVANRLNIMRLCRTHPTISVKEISHRLSLTDSTVRRHLRAAGIELPAELPIIDGPAVDAFMGRSL